MAILLLSALLSCSTIQKNQDYYPKMIAVNITGDKLLIIDTDSNGKPDSVSSYSILGETIPDSPDSPDNYYILKFEEKRKWALSHGIEIPAPDYRNEELEKRFKADVKYSF